MDHSLAVRQNTERIWNIRRGETGSRRNRRRVHHCMSFRERRKIRYTLELLRILEAAAAVCAVMMIEAGTLWIGMILVILVIEFCCRYIEKSIKKQCTCRKQMHRIFCQYKQNKNSFILYTCIGKMSKKMRAKSSRFSLDKNIKLRSQTGCINERVMTWETSEK